MFLTARKIIVTALAFAICSSSMAQQSRLIQYSGVVMSADSENVPVPFASVYNQSLHLGTIANYQGFFTFAAHGGDTIEVSSVGFLKGEFIVPEIPESQGGYTTVILLNPDVKTLPETTIYPWFSKAEFRDAFLHMNIPEDDIARAKENMNNDRLRAMGQGIADPNINAHQVIANNAATYYYQGQYRPMPILSPTAWMQFFSELKNGDFKNPQQ